MSAVWQKIKADLLGRKVVSTLIICTITAASALLTLALFTLANLGSPYDKSFTELNGAHLWLHFKPGLVRSMDIRQIENMSEVEASTGCQYSYNTQVNVNTSRVWVSMRVISLQQARVNRLRLLAGRFLTPGADEILISKDLRDIYHLSVGDTVQVTDADGRKVTLPVVGIVYDPMYDSYRSTQPPYLYLAEGLLESLIPDKASWGWSLGLRLKDPEAVEETLGRIEAMREIEFIDSHTDWHDVRSSAIFDAQLAFIFLTAFSFFAILATVLIVVSIVSSTVLSQIRQIGILKAVGFTSRQVLMVYTGQYAVLGWAGTVLGFLLGLVLAPVPMQTVTSALNVSYRPPFDPYILLVVLVAVPGVTLLAAFISAWRGAKINIIQAIAVGAEAPQQKSYWIARLAESLGMPVSFTLGLNDVFVKPLRSTLAGVNLMLGVMGVVFGLALSGTIQTYRDHPALLGIVHDATVTRQQSSDEHTRRLISQAPGVEAYYAESLVEVETLEGLLLKLRAVEGDLPAFPFQIDAGRFFQPGSYEAIAGRGLLDWLGLKVGDTLTLRFEDEDGAVATWLIVGQYPEPADAGQRLMVELSSVKPFLRHVSPFTYYLKLDPAADRDKTRTYLAPREDSDLNFVPVEDAIPSTIIYLQLAIFMLAGILIGIAIVNVLIVSLISAQEKRRLVGILKTVGMTPAQVIAMFNVTAGTLGLLSTFLGLPAGLMLTRTILNLLSSFTGFGQVNLSLNWTAALALIPFTLLVSVFGSYLPARWAARTHIVKVLRQE